LTGSVKETELHIIAGFTLISIRSTRIVHLWLWLVVVICGRTQVRTVRAVMSTYTSYACRSYVVLCNCMGVWEYEAIFMDWYHFWQNKYWM